MTVISYGLRIGLRVPCEDLLAGLLERLPPGAKTISSRAVDRQYTVVSDEEPGPNVLYTDGERLADGHGLDRIGDAFEADVRLYVAEMARGRVFVHAGAVGWRGRAIVLPGPSASGKTTLVAALVRAGATYYSDEYSVLDVHGRVHPYPRPLSIRRDSGGGRRKCPVEELGGRRGRRPLPVGLVVVSAYRRGAVWQARSLSAGRGALALLANTVSVRRQPAVALAAVSRVVERAAVLEGIRGEAGPMVDSLVRGVSKRGGQDGALSPDGTPYRPAD